MAKKQQIDYNALPDIEEVDYSALPDIEGDSKKKEPSTEVSKSLEEPSTSVGTDDVTTQGLSFREQERESVPDYMGLFDNKDKVEAANSLGVSLDFYNQVNQAAKSAERPTEFLFDVENMKRRLNALPEYFPELSSDVEAIKSKLKDVNALNIESIKASVDAIEGKVYSPPVSFGMMGDVNTGNPNWTNYEQEVLKNPQALATERLLMDTKNVRQAASEEGGVGSIVSGTGKGLEKWLVDWAKFSDDLRSNPAVKQMEDKLFSDNPDKKEFWESLTTDERILARAIVDNYQTRASLLEQVPTSFKIGEAVGQSIGFMAEFAATAGAGAGTATTIRGLAGAGKLSRMGVGAWAKLAQSGIQVAAMPTLYRNIALDVSKGESFGKSMLDNYWELGAETLSERIFLKNPATKDALSAADRIFRRMGINFATDKGYAGVVKNIAEEYTEEKFSEIATAPKDYKDFRSFWNEFVDKENLAVTLGSVSIMVGAPGGAVTTLDKAGRVYDQVKMKRLENIVPKDIREEVDVILSDTELGVKEQYDLIIQSVNDRATQEELGENPADMAANVLRYAKAKVKERVQETAENENWQEQRVAETETPTVGKVEPVGEMQTQLDYLKERGVEVPDGSKEADVDKLYRQERVKAIKEGNAELDGQIAEAQARLGLETTPDVEISDDTELTLEQLDNGEPVTNEFLKKASDELYEKYNELEAMKQSDSRVYTTEQIESMQEFLGEEITKLENYAKEQAETGKFVGETETGEVTERGAEEVVEVKPKIKEDGKEMQEREGAQQGVQKPEDEVTERGEETAEAVEAAGEEAVNKPIETNKSGTNFYDPTKLEKEEFDVEIDREDVAAPQDRGGGKMFERIRVWSKKKYPNKIIEGGVRNSVDVIKRNDGSVAVEYNNTIVEAKSEQDAIDMATSFLSVLDRDASAQLIKPTTAPQKPSDRVSPEKGVTTPQKEKVAETAPTQAEAAKVEQGAGIKPKNVRDVYKAGREVFGLNRAQALAQAVVVDRIIGKIAKRRGVNKSKVYSEIEFRKSTLEDLSKESRNLYQAVWHGSPHAFEKFTTDKIGTGEGAQAFGWGLYFTDRKGIAEGYAKMGNRNVIKVNGIEFRDYVSSLLGNEFASDRFFLNNPLLDISKSKADLISSLDKIIKSNKKLIEDDSLTDEDFDVLGTDYYAVKREMNIAQKIKDDVLSIDEKNIKSPQRNLYKVKLHGDRAIDDFNYLRWDKEVSNDVIQRIKEKDKSLGENLERWRDEGVVPASARNDNFDGKNVYKYIESYLGSPKEASLFLLDAKIDGIKYPTEITRKGTHEESFNYVIFDENVAEIEEHIKFQRGQGAKGAIQFLEDGNAIIHALTDPNVSTPLHEIAHLYEKYMSKAERDAVLKWAKHKEWTTETSEKFARGFEKYLAEGKAPNTALQKVFDRFKEWLTDIYNGITGSEIDLELNDEMRAVYSAMLGEDVVGVSMEQRRAKLERETKKAENKERLARIFENAARLTGARKDVVGDERKQIRKQLIDDIIEYVKTEFELAGQALVDRVKSFVKENNLPVEDLQDNEITKSKSYAEEIGEKVKKPVQEKGTEQKEVRQVRVRDDEKDRVETKPPKKGVKESRLGVRYAFGEGFSEKAKEEYAAKGLHEYDPEKQEDVIAIAKSIMELNDLDKIQRIFDNKQLPRRVRTVVGALLAQEYSNHAEKFLKAGDLKNGDDFIDREQAVMKSMQDNLAKESGQDVAIFGNKLIMEILTPYKTARQIERSITNRRDDIRKSKSFKDTKTIVEGELSDLRRSVLREVGKQQRVVEAKKKATRKKDPEKEKIRNRISSLKDQLRAARRGSASMSIVGLSSEEIEILGNIAVEYVKLGFVNIKQLVQKLKKDAADVGLTLTDEQAKSVIPKIDGKDVETLEKEQAIQEAAERLALKEFGHVADKKTKKDDPVLQMVNVLVSKFKERAEEGEKPKRKSALDIVTEAIVNKDKYMSVWKAAKKEVDDLIDGNEDLSAEQKELYKERVAQAYKNATEFSVSERQVQQLIRDTLREQNISIDDVVRDHYDRKELHKQQLIRDLQKRAGLDGEAAQELADVIDNAFNTLMAEKGTKIVDRYLGKKNKKQTKKEHKDEVARLIELVNIGALDTVEGNELMLDLYGVRNLTSEEKTRIKNLSMLVQKTKSPQERHKNAQRLMSYVYSLQKVDPAEVAIGFWYGNVLFGMGTHTKNYFEAYISSWVETFKMAGLNPMVLKRAILAHFRGYWKEGGVRLRETMWTGVTPIQKRFDIPGILERGDFAAAEGSGIIGKVNMTLLNWYKNALKYNLRLLPGFDSLIYASAQEVAADVMATREVLASHYGQKMTKELRRQVQKEIDIKLALTPDIRATIEAKVEKESQEYADLQESLGEPRTGYSKMGKAIRVYELINEARPINIVQDAYDIAGRTLGNIAPYGLIGRVVTVASNQMLRKVEATFRKPIYQLKNITKKGRPVFTFQEGKEIKVKPLALVMAFTRIVANVATGALGGHLLVAIDRARKGRYGIFLGKNDPYRVEMTELEKTTSKRWIWQLATLYTLLYILTEPGEDDEDPVLQITLNGTGDYKRNKKELEPTGWRQYSIIVTNPFNREKDFHIDYRLLRQFAPPLMAIGYMRDQQRYQGSEKSDMALFLEGLLVSIPLILETTPIFGLRKLTDAFFDITKGGDDGFNKLLQLTGGMGTGFIPVPRVFSDFEDIWDTVNGEPHKTAITGYEKLLQYIPFYGKVKPFGRTALDVFGYEIPAAFSVKSIIGNSKENPLIQYYLNNGYKRPIHEMNNTSFLLYDEDGNIVRRKLKGGFGRRNEVELFNDYDQAIGMAFEKAVQQAANDGLEGQEMVDFLDKSWREIVDNAKKAVFAASQDFPVKYDKDAEIIQ